MNLKLMVFITEVSSDGTWEEERLFLGEWSGHTLSTVTGKVLDVEIKSK